MVFRSDCSAQVFRIGSAAYPIFDGGGAHRWGSRWCTPGRSIIHAARACSLALLENLVHWNTTRLPPEMCYVVATIPGELETEELDPERLPDWDRPDYRISQPYGDAWYDAGETAVLIVPSVFSPFEPNVLINQRHPDASRIEVSVERPLALDERLRR